MSSINVELVELFGICLTYQHHEAITVPQAHLSSRCIPPASQETSSQYRTRDCVEYSFEYLYGNLESQSRISSSSWATKNKYRPFRLDYMDPHCEHTY
jgi:hypothetical protein